MFGKAHYRENGDQPNSLWVTAISRLSDQQLVRALANLGNDNLQFTPNLSQFVAAAKRKPPVRYLGTDRYLPPPERELTDEERAEALQSRIDALRKVGLHERADALEIEHGEVFA